MTNLARGFAKFSLAEDPSGLSPPACEDLMSLDKRV